MKRKFTEEQFKVAATKVFSYAGLCRELGLSPKGGNIATMRKYISIWSIDDTHFTGQKWSKGKTILDHPSIRSKPIEQILIENSGWNSHNIKNKLFNLGIKIKQCECCKNTEWNKQPIPLELHHINGINNDHRLINLQILCPNCHSQTENFSRNKPT